MFYHSQKTLMLTIITIIGATIGSSDRGEKPISIPEDKKAIGIIEFVNCSLENSRNAGIIISNKPAKFAWVRFVNCTVSNPALNNKRSPIIFNTRRGSTEDIGGVKFVNCVIKDPLERVPISFENWSGEVGFADVNGLLTVERNNTKLDYNITQELIEEWNPIILSKKNPE